MTPILFESCPNEFNIQCQFDMPLPVCAFDLPVLRPERMNVEETECADTRTANRTRDHVHYTMSLFPCNIFVFLFFCAR